MNNDNVNIAAYDDDDIDLKDIFLYLVRNLWLILIVVAVFAGAAFWVTDHMIAPKYTASTRIYVLNRANENMIAYSDLQISSQFVEDYQELITGRNVTATVISKLGLSMTEKQLKKAITVISPTNTRIVQIDVENESPKQAAQIADCVREVATEQIQSIMDIEAVHLVYAAEVPKEPSSPNILLYTAVGGMLGLVLILAILFIAKCADSTIRSEEDVQRYLSLGVLGSVPVFKK